MEIYGFYKGEKKSLTQLAAESGVSYDTLLARYKAGVPFGELTDVAGKSGGVSDEELAQLRSEIERFRPNLLDNSDFRNPVNQRGQTDYTTSANLAYTIDRWLKRGTVTSPITLSANGITITNDESSTYIGIRQAVAFDRFPPAGKTVTAAIKVKSLSGSGRIRVTSGSVAGGDTTVYGNKIFSSTGIVVLSCTVPSDFSAAYFGMSIIVADGSTVTVEWAALYEGEYTADTLPEYQPKGYAEELLECQRYYYRMSAGADARTTTTGGTRGINTYFYLPLPVPMRGEAAPTLSYDLLDIYPFETGKSETITFLEATLLSSRNGVALRAVHDTTYTARDAMLLRLKANGYLSLSMDL